MTAQNNLDLKGDFRQHPFAELLVEVLHARLSGSLRLSHAKKKCIIYFRDGLAVHAVSNAREHRLFSVLLGRNRIDQKTLGGIPEFASDLELSIALERKGIFTKAEIDEFTVNQIESIVIDVLTWPDGQWHFSTLTRLREDLNYKVDVYKVLIEYARCLPSHDVYQRFKSVPEAFYRAPKPVGGGVLQPHEQYLLDRFNGSQLTIEQLRPICSLPETAMLQSLYVLWLGGLLIRRDWNSAFSATKVGEILTARVSRIKRAEQMAKPAPGEAVPIHDEKLPDIQISLEDYLERVEKAETLYEALGIDQNARLNAIKHSYFGLAKLFHPDRFHREEPVALRRIQTAFTQIAHAYETLKNEDARVNYNLKLEKEEEYRKKRRDSGQADATSSKDRQGEQGLESFEKGMEAIRDEEFAAAAGHLSRAVHYSGQNALFHAYFGYALSQLDKQHHKAEAELQIAVKLEPKNPKIRMMLVEFFVDMKMARRAEGELKRFLELVPENKDAARLLAKVQANTGV
ncbi:MAG TPA: DnaJ domain-containing protein [Pyrinomonadaceae bacterium]|nr:DnaJ domain-containing protein [Pyrinomonadaceae bacterium]